MDHSRLDQVVADARRAAEQRELGYREQALKLYPWVCGRCGREFTRANLRELTVHHRNHDHAFNPQDGSNWELLCLYCHDNEHARYLDPRGTKSAKADAAVATGNPFSGLKALLDTKKQTK
jgi:5-methylcytosine-specific restriction endonuclease McrA